MCIIYQCALTLPGFDAAWCINILAPPRGQEAACSRLFQVAIVICSFFLRGSLNRGPGRKLWLGAAGLTAKFVQNGGPFSVQKMAPFWVQKMGQFLGPQICFLIYFSKEAQKLAPKMAPKIESKIKRKNRQNSAKPAPLCALQVGIHGTPLPRPGGHAKTCIDALPHVDVLCFMLLLPSFSNHFITPFKCMFALLSKVIMILTLLDASMHIGHSIFQTIHKQASTVTPQRSGTTNCYVSWPQNWGHES